MAPPRLTLDRLSPEQQRRYRELFLKRKPIPRLAPGTWYGGRLLGQGGTGIAGLWVRADNNTNTIQDRLVVKETQWGKQNYENEDAYYYDPPTPPFLIWNRIPREAFCLRALRPVAGARDHTLRLRNWTKSTKTYSWRFYLDFADMGDLHGIIETHRGWNDMTNQRLTPGRQLPEAFLWYAFESLAIAATQMIDLPSLQNHPGHAWPTDRQIIHQDLKPGNVFLAAPDPNYFPCYPQVKLADFGGSRLTHPADPMNPDHFRRRDLCTPGFDPPEHFLEEHVIADQWLPLPKQPLDLARGGHTMQPLLSPTNIWQIGRVILALMERDYDPDQINYYTKQRDHIRADRRGRDGWVPETRNLSGGPNSHVYSAALRQLVRHCLQVDPADRPTADTVRQRCRDRINHYWAHERDRTEPFPYHHRRRPWNKTAYEDALFAVGASIDHLQDAPTFVAN